MNTETAPQVEMVSELPNVREQFTEWLAREMPAGTVIGNPRWWAPKIIRAFHDYRTIARERDKLTSPGAAELPDLPDSYGDHCVTDSVRTMREPGYTADQMRAYAQAALNARAGGDGWLPIESAPKSVADGRRVDGIYLLGFIPDADACDPLSCMDTIWWEPLLPNTAGGRGKWCAGKSDIEVSPTHWQPLPTPPAALASQAVGV